MRRCIFIITILFSFIIILGYLYVNNTVSKMETKFIEQKALTVTMAVLSGEENYLKKVSNADAYNYISDAIRNSSDKTTRSISISASSYDKVNNTYMVISQIYELPQTKTVLFYEMVFERIDNEWILISFAQDA